MDLKLWFLGFILLVYIQIINTIKFSIKEETKIDTPIGTIAHLHPTLKSPRYIIRSPFIRITKYGKVVLIKQIDRESICNDYQKCCGAIVCVVPATLLVRDTITDKSISLTIELEIEDINDNIPRFSKPTQLIQVAENQPIGQYVFLEQAYDADINPTNQINHYNFKENTHTFELDQTRLPSIGLVIKKQLDYEHKKQYGASLIACDTGMQCTTQKLLIKIIDKNDNYPIFKQVNYEIQILENFPIGQQILKVEAYDADSNEFNKVLYGFHGVVDINLKETLIITENTGSIKLQKPLSAKIRSRYQFKVFAVDKADVTSHKSTANVVIKVKDLNDHRPVINLLNMDSPRLEVPENEPPYEIVSFEVTDDDIGANANVSCTLNPGSYNDFQLVLNGHNIYSLNTRRKFNYEVETQLKTVIKCIDQGIPPKYETKPLTIYVIDKNEYAPQCGKLYYRISLKENRAPNEAILKINGTDEDGSAKLHYSVAGAGRLYFHIDPLTGQIYSSDRTLDKESMDEVDITVNITDGPDRDKSTKYGQCRITVEILDENDHEPTFTIDPRSPFNIQENEPAFSRVDGILTATDNDKSDENNRVRFQLDKIYGQSLNRIHKDLFDVTESGFIQTRKKLDREVNFNYTLTIKAYDSGRPSKSSKMNITINVIDQNDNAPEWTNPKMEDGVVPALNITANLQPGIVVMKLNAYDKDNGENSRISYKIMNNNRLLFNLNSSTGELSVARLLPVGSVHLFLRASDHGYPPQHSETSMLVFISGNDVAALNMSIILVLIGVTGIVALFLIIAIVCVQRKPRYSQQNHQIIRTGESEHSFEAATTKSITGPIHYMDNNNFLYGGGPNNNLDECRQSLQGAAGMYAPDSTSICYMPDIDPSLPLHTFVPHNYKYPPANIDNHTGVYGTLSSPASGIIGSSSRFIVSPGSVQDLRGGNLVVSSAGPNLDDDSADSGKGASEDDPGCLLMMQHQLAATLHHQSGSATLDYTQHKNRLYSNSSNNNYNTLSSYQYTNNHHLNRATSPPNVLPHRNHSNNHSSPNDLVPSNSVTTGGCYVLAEEQPQPLSTPQSSNNNNQFSVTTFTQLT